MKYQINALLTSIWKSKIWIIVWMLILLLDFYSISIKPEITRNDMLGMLGILLRDDNKRLFSYDILFSIFQVCFVIYIYHLYFEFEHYNSNEFISNRLSYKKNYKEKCIITLIFTIILRVLYYLIIYGLFKQFVYFKTSDFIINIIEYVLLWQAIILVRFLIQKNYKC